MNSFDKDIYNSRDRGSRSEGKEEGAEYFTFTFITDNGQLSNRYLFFWCFLAMRQILTEMYSETNQTDKMELLAKIVKVFPAKSFTKSSILDASHGSKYTSSVIVLQILRQTYP